MTGADLDGQAVATGDRFRGLLAVSEAIVSHRDLSALFHELAGRLRQVVHFDYLGLALHEATSNTLRIHLLEGAEPTPLPSPPVLPLEEEPAGWVWQTQQAWIFSNVPEEKRWPRALERVKRYGVQRSSRRMTPFTRSWGSARTRCSSSRCPASSASKRPGSSWPRFVRWWPEASPGMRA